ncbi:heterokaryon incompatibility protein-domain-containing protein [Suillus bovinus]|uniref:heterokaryon incompatibility protein-domain-containing protein n=1 Tax=Suillus bovinus TaxID=48563 RepID=UPI001B875DBD|nr:heterokaryon incompatibility protein-domain-containing protein [Suillus bovinus]KAG2159391.1 heterokaryon incompatibility protein-domain-containing protein [Suillus bovinus]
MRLLHTKKLILDTPTDVRPYAILSHRWLAEREEISFQDLQPSRFLPSEGSHDDYAEPTFPSDVQSKQGFEKFQGAYEYASRAALEYIWIDTCCIDKTSSAELSEAINSMYAWYRDSAVCYVYLHDVGDDGDPESGFEDAEWFQRGWTLQELIAPDNVYFFNKYWVKIGSKATFAPTLSKITRIRQDILLGDQYEPSIAEKMSWAAGRKTQRIEDRAYSLMGLFGIHMPIIYGEGDKAFRRLQLEIMKSSDDQTIFAWHDSRAHPHSVRNRGLLASTPDVFMRASPVVAIDHSHFISILPWSRSLSSELSRGYHILNDGIHITLPMKRVAEGWLAVLRCRKKDQEFPYGIYLKERSGSDDFLRTSPTKLKELESTDLQGLTPRTIRIVVDYHVLPTTKRRQFFTFQSTDPVWQYCGYYVCPTPGDRHDVGQGGGYRDLEPCTRIELSDDVQCCCVYSQGLRGEVSVLLIGIKHHRPWLHLLTNAGLYRYVDTSRLGRRTICDIALVSSPTSPQSSSLPDLLSPTPHDLPSAPSSRSMSLSSTSTGANIHRFPKRNSTAPYAAQLRGGGAGCPG